MEDGRWEMGVTEVRRDGVTERRSLEVDVRSLARSYASFQRSHLQPRFPTR
jgi:hypothetical protein